MRVKKLRKNLATYANRRGLSQKLTKQIRIFEANPRHPSLHTEIIGSKSLRLYSFRIDHKYRAVFIFTDDDEIEIVDINNHYAR